MDEDDDRVVRSPPAIPGLRHLLEPIKETAQRVKQLSNLKEQNSESHVGPCCCQSEIAGKHDDFNADLKWTNATNTSWICEDCGATLTKGAYQLDNRTDSCRDTDTFERDYERDSSESNCCCDDTQPKERERGWDAFEACCKCTGYDVPFVENEILFGRENLLIGDEQRAKEAEDFFPGEDCSTKGVQERAAELMKGGTGGCGTVDADCLCVRGMPALPKPDELLKQLKLFPFADNTRQANIDPRNLLFAHDGEGENIGIQISGIPAAAGVDLNNSVGQRGDASFSEVVWPGIKKPHRKIIEARSNGPCACKITDADCQTCSGCQHLQRILEQNDDYQEMQDVKTRLPDYRTIFPASRIGPTKDDLFLAQRTVPFEPEMDCKISFTWCYAQDASTSGTGLLSKVQSRDLQFCHEKIGSASADSFSKNATAVTKSKNEKPCSCARQKSKPSDKHVIPVIMLAEDDGSSPCEKQTAESKPESGDLKEELCPCGCGYFVDGVSQTDLCDCENSSHCLLKSVCKNDDPQRSSVPDCKMTYKVCNYSESENGAPFLKDIAKENTKEENKVPEKEPDFTVGVKESPEFAECSKCCDVTTDSDAKNTNCFNDDATGIRSLQETHQPKNRDLQNINLFKEKSKAKTKGTIDSVKRQLEEADEQLSLDELARKLEENIRIFKKENEYLRKQIENCRCSGDEVKELCEPPPIRATHSGLVAAAEVLEAKCRSKDGMIAALVKGLRGSKNMEQLVKNLVAPCLQYTYWDFDRCALYSYLRGFLTPLAARKERLIELPSSQSNVNEGIPPPRKLTVVQEICRCLLLSWKPPVNISNVSGYEIFVDGDLMSRIRSPTRTEAILEYGRLFRPIEIALHAVGKNSELSNPVTITYPSCVCAKN